MLAGKENDMHHPTYDPDIQADSFFAVTARTLLGRYGESAVDIATAAIDGFEAKGEKERSELWRGVLNHLVVHCPIIHSGSMRVH